MSKPNLSSSTLRFEKENVTQVGYWEQEEPTNSLYCVDCGGELKEPKVTASGIVRRHYYKIGGRIVCPSCFVTARIHPNIKRSA